MAYRSVVGLKKRFFEMPEDAQVFLAKLEPLLDDSRNLEIALAYCFMKLEEGHHRALKCGLIRLHACDSAKTDEMLNRQHFTKDKYAEVFKNVFSSSIPSSTQTCHAKAQDVRNKAIHGKTISDADRRKGIYNALSYMDELGEFVKNKTEKNPYGDLRGLAGKKYLLAPKSTIWMLKGFGLGSVS